MIKPEDLLFSHQIYTKVCSECGKKHTVATQPDKVPEYYTIIAIQCSCGSYVGFELPVN